MIEIFLRIFFYPASKQWEKDYDIGNNTRVKSVISGMISGACIGVGLAIIQMTVL